MSDQHQRPRTAEQFEALQVGPEYDVARYEITDADRRRGYAEISGGRYEIVHSQIQFIEIPIAPEIASFWSEQDDTISWVDVSGAWVLGRYADGRWFKKRV